MSAGWRRHETERGLRGFLARRARSALALRDAARFTFLYLTRARAVRRRYAEAERRGERIVLDRGPFTGETGGRDEVGWP